MGGDIYLAPMPSSAPPSAVNQRVYLLEDHEMFRLGLQSIIDGAEGFSVVGGSDSVMKASADIHKCKPDIVLCDLQLRGESGLRLIQTLRRMGPLPLIAVLTSHDDPRLVAQCKKEGANAFIRKDQPVMEVLEQLAGWSPADGFNPLSSATGTSPNRPRESARSLRRSQRCRPASSIASSGWPRI